MLEWLLRPWLRGQGFARRAGRVCVVAGLVLVTVLPGMMLYYGIDDWWWDATALVALLATAGTIVFDQLAEIAGRRVAGLLRLALLSLGLFAGILCAYALLSRWRGSSGPNVWRDFRRTLGILGPVLAAAGVTATSLWYRAEAFRLQSEAATARFNVLKGQMQPHFLFNALNSLKELIADDPRLAADTTQRVADLYRLILKVSREATATLADELAIVESYLEIERVRFGDRLRYRIEAADDLRGLHVPSLMLQTLAENAVKHGVCKAREGGEVRVSARRDAGGLCLEVHNTGAPFVAPTGENGQTGLANTRARLDLMYGADSRFTIGSDTRGTCVSFVVTGKCAS